MSRILQIIFLFLAAGLVPPVTHAEIAGGMPAMTLAELPKEGRETLALIRKGGPYPFSKDGTIFSNRERALPRELRGFYHEYTVKTPGARDRGARRIICGGKQQQVCYSTADHYKTFKRIKE